MATLNFSTDWFLVQLTDFILKGMDKGKYWHDFKRTLESLRHTRLQNSSWKYDMSPFQNISNAIVWALSIE